MQKVMVQIDWYTKIILTLIVVLLAGIFTRLSFSSDISKAKAEDIIQQRVGMDEQLSLSETDVMLTQNAARLEGSKFLVETLYFEVLQDLSYERALENIKDYPILSHFTYGKRYAEFLITLEKDEALRLVSDETIRTVLLSGRFEVTPDGIARIPLEVEVANFPLHRQQLVYVDGGTIDIRQSRKDPIYVEVLERN